MFNFITIQSTELSSQKRLWLVALSFLIGVFYDIFVYKQQLGLGFFIFVNLSVILFLLFAIYLKQFSQLWSLLLLIPIWGLSAPTILYNNYLVTYFVPVFLFIFCLFFFILSTLKNESKFKFKLTNIPVIRSIDLPILKWGEVYRDLFRRHQENSNHYKRIMIGLIIGLPIVIIFGVLFYFADQIFADFFNNIIKNLLSQTLPWRITRTIVFTLFISGFLYVLVDKNNHLLEFKEKNIKSDKIIAGTILILINVIFLLFVFIQIKYLFGSANYVFSSNYTFAEYARRGFFELAGVLGIVAIILLIIYRSLCKENFSKIVACLQTLLIIQTAVIAVSALKRMDLYQDFFGFTVKRLYVEWFIYFALFILSLAAIGIIFNVAFRKFFYSTIIVGIVAMTVVSLINVDGIIAKENVDRYLDQKKELDMEYLVKLSIDAYPEIRRAFENGYKFESLIAPITNASSTESVYKYGKNNYNDLYVKNARELKLHSSYSADYAYYPIRIKSNYNWREWNYNRMKVYNLIGATNF